MTTPIRLSLAEVLPRVLASHGADEHTALPGIVKSYDSGNQTADVEIALTNPVASFQDEDEDGRETFPVLVNVPVMWPRAGEFFLHFPLTQGDSVMVIFSELDPGAWRQSGSVSDPGNPTRKSLAYGAAVPGYYPQNNTMDNADATHGRIGKGGVFIEFRTSEIRAGGSDTLAMSGALSTHLDKIAQSLDALGAGLTVPIVPVYGTLGRTALQLSAPISSTVLKGA